MKPWNIFKRKNPTPKTMVPAQQKQQLIEKMQKGGASEYEIKMALKKWEADRSALGFKSN